MNCWHKTLKYSGVMMIRMESLFTFNVYTLASFVTKANMNREDGLYR